MPSVKIKIVMLGTAERTYIEPRSIEVILFGLAESWKRIQRIKDEIYLENNSNL